MYSERGCRNSHMCADHLLIDWDTVALVEIEKVLEVDSSVLNLLPATYWVALGGGGGEQLSLSKL